MRWASCFVALWLTGCSSPSDVDEGAAALLSELGAAYSDGLAVLCAESDVVMAKTNRELLGFRRRNDGRWEVAVAEDLPSDELADRKMGFTTYVDAERLGTRYSSFRSAVAAVDKAATLGQLSTCSPLAVGGDVDFSKGRLSTIWYEATEPDYVSTIRRSKADARFAYAVIDATFTETARVTGYGGEPGSYVRVPIGKARSTWLAVFRADNGRDWMLVDEFRISGPPSD